MAVLPPDRVVSLLRERTAALAEKSAELRSTVDTVVGDGVPRMFLIELEYERALTEADLTFTRTLAADIESGGLDGVAKWRDFHAGKAVEWLTHDNHEEAEA
jgi:class 3 adenylate cyclase